MQMPLVYVSPSKFPHLKLGMGSEGWAGRVYRGSGWPPVLDNVGRGGGGEGGDGDGEFEGGALFGDVTSWSVAASLSSKRWVLPAERCWPSSTSGWTIGEFSQWPSRQGRQSTQLRPDFLHEQFLQRPLELQRQQTGMLLDQGCRRRASFRFS